MMPAYDFVCDQCGHTHEVYVKVELRDALRLECPNDGIILRRKFTFPMATLWAGKFQGRALKKTNYDGLGAEW